MADHALTPHPTPEGFTFALPIQVRWRDFDALGHLNNAAYLTYAEQARVTYVRDVLGNTWDNMPWTLADTHCRYVSAITLGDTVTIFLRTTKIGRSSLAFAFAIYTGKSDGRVAADGEQVMVHMDAEGRPAPIPDAWRRAISAFEGTDLG